MDRLVHKSIIAFLPINKGRNAMILLTDTIRTKLIENGQPENRDKDHEPVVKLFLPGTSFTWLLSELHYEDPDIAFGLCDLGMGCPELGSVRISELENLTIMNGIFGVERDLYFEAEYPMTVYAYAANRNDLITEDKIALRHASDRLNREKASGSYPSPD